MPAMEVSEQPEHKVYTQQAIDKALLEVWQKIAELELARQENVKNIDIDDKIKTLTIIMQHITEDIAVIKAKKGFVEYIQFWKR